MPMTSTNEGIAQVPTINYSAPSANTGGAAIDPRPSSDRAEFAGRVPVGGGLGNIGQQVPISEDTALWSGIEWLGNGYLQIAPGVYRSADGSRQFRFTNADITGAHGDIGPHVHFESLDANGNVTENNHVPVR